MSDKITIHPQPIIPFKPAAKVVGSEQIRQDQLFNKTLEAAVRQQSGVKFSAHAMERLQQRNLKLQDADLSKINDAMDKARKKGINSSLVLFGDLALIASIKNNTIVTAVDTKAMKDHVFTGIDGAVIIE